MGHITERADKFARQFVAPKPVPPPELTQAEKEAAFAQTYGTAPGLKGLYKQLREKRDNAG